MRRRAAIAAAVAVLAAGRLAAGDKPPDLRPWSLAIEVRWGGESGPEAFRSDVERQLAASLARGCAAGIEVGADAVRGGSSDLVLVATLDGFLEELRFDDSLAVAATPGEPTKELRKVAILDVDNALQLSTRAGSREVAAKSFHAAVHHRPVYLGEEPQTSARQLVVDKIVREAGRMLCKSSGKLAKRVQQELSAR